MPLSKTLPSLSLLIAFLLFTLTGLFLFADGMILYIDLVIILASIVAMNMLSTSKNFILVLTITLTTGFVLLFYQFFKGATLSSQIDYILQHILQTASLILIWLLFSTVKGLQEDVTVLKKRINELEKYEGSFHLLTRQEFKNRVQIISTGTRRRGEENYFVLFTLSRNDVTKDALDHVFSQVILDTVRAQFDLVTKLEDGSYLLFLQNTDENGCQIVVNRLFQSLRKNLEQSELPVSFTISKEDEINKVDTLSFMMETDAI
ncbi:hypothetical protein [Mesobacillus maritimus]|uniref:GGDEF domain-containing protein n=1 Tax=Mesobacillus maritimus TaxID=1643336 RepID=A0ABS7K500_9BACI|nr:hypothetical protein [Mesobacillus maritimus]MBY0097338.1 hypothetical protein [Mesobacillus maritimus]